MIIEEQAGNLILSEVEDFNLKQILECGQCFHYKEIAQQEYGLTAFHRLLHIRQDGDRVIFYDTSREEYDRIWSAYFDMEQNYGKIKKLLSESDQQLKGAIEEMYGVRILKQDFFETLISFIISQNKQIPHIKQIVAQISEEYGDYLGEINGEKFYAFPTPEQLSQVTEEQLRACKTGFRAPYICDAVAKICDGSITEEMFRNAAQDQCEELLTTIKGVGVKVANCVMLFGLGRTEAFPIDVWIKRIMESLYFNGEETDNAKITSYAKEKYGIYGGYAQQYLFYYGKTAGIGVKKKKNKTA